MSYEGAFVHRCEIGHIAEYDAYMDPDESCPYCGSEWIDERQVDLTNGLSSTFDLRQLTPALYAECPCCKAIDVLKHPTYEFVDREFRDTEYQVLDVKEPVTISRGPDRG